MSWATGPDWTMTRCHCHPGEMAHLGVGWGIKNMPKSTTHFYLFIPNNIRVKVWTSQPHHLNLAAPTTALMTDLGVPIKMLFCTITAIFICTVALKPHSSVNELLMIKGYKHSISCTHPFFTLCTSHKTNEKHWRGWAYLHLNYRCTDPHI